MGRSVKWTKEACIDEARKFVTKGDWAKGSPSSYSACKKYGDEVFKLATSHMKKSKSVGEIIENEESFSKEDCLADAKKYESISDWQENSEDIYVAAKKFGSSFFSQCVKHMKSNEDDGKSDSWSKDACIEEAKKFETQNEWKLMSPESLRAAISYGREFFNHCIKHMKKDEVEYSNEDIMNDAQRFLNKSDWSKASPEIFKYARKLGEEFLKKCTDHMLEDKWDRDSISKEALKYNSKKEWIEKSPNSYMLAKKISETFFNKCCEHMDFDSSSAKRWTKDRVLDEARKYTSIAEWIRRSEHSFRSAEIYGEDFLNMCLSHMKD